MPGQPAGPDVIVRYIIYVYHKGVIINDISTSHPQNSFVIFDVKYLNINKVYDVCFQASLGPHGNLTMNFKREIYDLAWDVIAYRYM